MGAAEAHTTTFAWCLIASVRARLNDRSRSFEAELSRLFRMKVVMFGTAIIARTPATASVTMSSVSVKPRCVLTLAGPPLDRSVTNMFSSSIMRRVTRFSLRGAIYWADTEKSEYQFTLAGAVRRAVSFESQAVAGRDIKHAHRGFGDVWAPGMT